jgi:TonB family protein
MALTRALATALFVLLAPCLGSGQEPRPSPPAVDKEWAAARGLVLDYDEAPKAVKVGHPQYPDGAFKRHVQGTVVVDLAIDATGRVSEVHVAQSIAGLDQAAVDCVKAWTFTPARKNGQPVASAARAPIAFGIPNSRYELGPLSMPSEAAAGRGMLLRSFQSNGADFMAWFGEFKGEIYAHWPVSKTGKWGREVDVEFVIERDGRVSKIRTLGPSATTRFNDSATHELEDAVYFALRASHLPALPADYAQPRITLRILFSTEEPQGHPVAR